MFKWKFTSSAIDDKRIKYVYRETNLIIFYGII